MCSTFKRLNCFEEAVDSGILTHLNTHADVLKAFAPTGMLLGSSESGSSAVTQLLVEVKAAEPISLYSCRWVQVTPGWGQGSAGGSVAGLW